MVADAFILYLLVLRDLYSVLVHRVLALLVLADHVVGGEDALDLLLL